MRRLGTGPVLAGIGIGTALLYFTGLAAASPALCLAVKPFPALALAAWVALRCPRPLGRLTAAGLIAFNRFAAPIPGVRWPIMILYWLGQSGIAASAVLGCGMLREQVKTR